MKSILPLVLLFTLISCATPETLRDQYNVSWVKSRKEVPQENWIYTVMPRDRMASFCITSQNLACAWVTPYTQCDIYLPIGYTQYMKWHEEQHCKGWTH